MDAFGLPRTLSRQCSRVINSMARLNSASRWTSFSMPKEDARLLQSVMVTVASLPGNDGKASGLFLTQQLELLAVVARGLRLLSEELQQSGSAAGQQQEVIISSLQQHPRQAATLCEVCRCAVIFCSKKPPGEEAVPQDKLVQVLVSSTRAGLLQHLEHLCSALTSCIDSTNSDTDAAGAALLQSSGVAVIAPCLVMLCVELAAIWPSECALLSPSFAPLVPAVAALALATLRNKAACPQGGCTCSLSSDGGSRCTCFKQHVVVDFDGTDDAVLVAACFAHRLARCLSLSVNAAGGSSSSSSVTIVPQQIATSSSVKELLLVRLGLAVQVVHQKQNGHMRGSHASTSDALQQQQQQQQLVSAVPAYHEQLLRALGVAECVQRDSARIEEAFGVVGLVPCLYLAAIDHFSVAALLKCSSSSSSCCVPSGHEESQRQPAAAVTPAAAVPAGAVGGGISTDLILPVLLVLLEGVALQPSKRTLILGTTVVRAYTKATSLRGQDLDRALFELIPPVLQVLLPTVKHVQAAAAAARRTPAAAAAAATEDQSEKVWGYLGCLVTCITCSCTLERGSSQSSIAMEALEAAIQQHEQEYCMLLEAYLRCRLRPTNDQVATYSQRALLTYMRLAAGRRHQGLFSLLTSHLKAMTLAAVNSGPSNSSSGSSSSGGAMNGGRQAVAEADLKGAERVMGAFQLAVTRDAPTTSVSSNNGSSSSSSNSETSPWGPTVAGGVLGRMWVYLLARSLVPVGRILQQLQQQQVEEQQQQQQQRGDKCKEEETKPASSDTSNGRSSSCSSSSRNVQFLQLALNHCTSAAEWLSTQGPGAVATEAAAMPGPAWQQLLEVQVPLLRSLLLQQLEQVSRQVAAAAAAVNTGVANCLSSAAAELGHQMEAIGAAVAAQLPVEQCCNYHGCINFSKDTELELVGGKGCVCGGCKAARYCSHACQVAHFKRWHKVVCKHVAAK